MSQHQKWVVQRKQYVAPQKDVMGEKADGDLVRRQNRGIVLQALRRQGPTARVELGRLTGLSPASITSIITQLIEDGAVCELNEPVLVLATVKRGRPTVRISLNAEAAPLSYCSGIFKSCFGSMINSFKTLFHVVFQACRFHKVRFESRRRNSNARVTGKKTLDDIRDN